jgi:hypothetical protein
MQDPFQKTSRPIVLFEIGNSLRHLSTPNGRKALGVIVVGIAAYKSPDFLLALASLLDAARRLWT